MSNPEKTIASESSRAVSVDPVLAAAARVVMERCDILGGVTDEAGRITRTFLSPATKRAQQLVSDWMREAGLVVRVDAAGNVVGRREAGRVNEKGAEKTFAIGSHLDTVPNAGKYDGVLGIIAGVALAELLRNEPLPFSLEVVAFSEEEGVRFGRPYIGSHAYAGTLDPAWLKLADKEGVTIEEAIRHFGLDPAPLKTLKPRRDLLAYLELHIEQGPALESKDEAVGIVTGIAAQTRMTLEVTGAAAHAGTTPMHLRHDALTCAAEIILAIETLARRKPSGVATVGHIEAGPNASNVVPASVRFSLDVRHEFDVQQVEGVKFLLDAANEIATRRGVKLSVLGRADFPSTALRGSVPILQDSGALSGANGLMTSGAGHDAVILAQVAPAAMLFIRSPGGISHSPAEAVYERDVAMALAVAHDAIVSLSQNPVPLLSLTQEPS